MPTQNCRISLMLPGLVCAAAMCWAQDLVDRGAPGVVVRLYDIGESVRWLPDLVPGQLPNAAKVVLRVDLDGARGDFAPLEDHFMTEVSGFINVVQPGTYAFQLISDDGAQLRISGRLVVDHDGLHGPTPKQGVIELKRGQHPFRVRHFEAGGDERLALLWKPPDAGPEADFSVIPASVFTHDAKVSRDTLPGKKRIIPPLRHGRPGDGTPVAGMHPGFDQTLLGTAMYGVQESRKCARLEIRTQPAPESTRSLILLPRDDHPATAISSARLADPRHPLGRRNLPAGGAESDPCFIPLVVGVEGHYQLYRVVTEEIGDTLQGSVFRFGAGFPGTISSLDAGIPGAIVVHLSVDRTEDYPDGRAICFLRPIERLAFEMLAVRAMRNGFEIEFTKALDPRCGWDPESYYIEQWPFSIRGTEAQRHEGTQGTEPGASATGHPPRRDGVRYPVKSASVSVDRKKVFLEIDGLKPSSVVYIRLLPPCISEDGELPWSTEAWYTLNAIPQDRVGEVLPPPAKRPQNFLTDEQRRAGWRLLFDGETTAGWRSYKKDAFPHQGWQVIDGCLVRIGSGGDIVTEDEFDDFELRLEWRICAGGNSGVFFRVSEELGRPWASGPEMQVLDNTEHNDARNTRTSAGANYALHAPVRDATQPVGLFNKARILADGSHIEHWLNGVKVVEYEIASQEWQRLVAGSKFKKMPHYGRVKKGHIVLQDHGDRVWYRNIKIRPLGRE